MMQYLKKKCNPNKAIALIKLKIYQKDNFMNLFLRFIIKNRNTTKNVFKTV